MSNFVIEEHVVAPTFLVNVQSIREENHAQSVSDGNNVFTPIISRTKKH
jgi:hypothetical protein